jgi:hypothetical protein
VTILRLAVLLLAIPAAVAAPAAYAAPRPALAPPAEQLPEPPIPPVDPPSDTDAPMPNQDLSAPRARLDEGPSIKPTLDSRPPTLPGGDPVPGTLYRSDQEQRRQFIPNPGVVLVVPLQK